MNISKMPICLKVVPVLDRDFYPIALMNQEFRDAVEKSGKWLPISIAIERGSGLISLYETKVFSEELPMAQFNLIYIEKLVKTLLWIKGGWKISIAGSKVLGAFIKNAYTIGGIREFDAKFMTKVFEKPFTVDIVDFDKLPSEHEESKPIGRHLQGFRIGFDAGGSDKKVSAVINGKAVFSEEFIWNPKIQSDPSYHYNEILSAMHTAASYLPKIDAIGISSAGVFVNNRIMVASLFVKVSEELFDAQVKDMFLNIQKAMGGVPMEVANDGDVTALACAMDLDDTNVLGIAMGTSEAGGYIDEKGNITGWLNELAFVPVDLNREAMIDEWSGDYGCGVKYFSQDAVIKLAPAAGIVLDDKLTPAQKLEFVQNLNMQGDERASKIFETIGVYFGYTLAHYSCFYDIKHVLILGRVTSGKGGYSILNKAEEVLKEEFPYLFNKINITLPDESTRRIGQSIAAASLPQLSN